jgi:hypothetical protein
MLGDAILIGVFVIPLLIAGLVVLLVRRNLGRQGTEAREQRAEADERAARGVWAQATVVNVLQMPRLLPGETPDAVKVDLRLEVLPPGGAKFLTLATWLVDTTALANVQAGATVPVKIDSRDPARVYPHVNWARPWVG